MLFLRNRAILEQYVLKVLVHIARMCGRQHRRDGNKYEGPNLACFDHCNIQVVAKRGSVLQ